MKLQTVVHSTPAPADAAHPRNTEASLLVRGDGSYVLAYTEFYGSGADDAGANIVSVRSRDGGSTWDGKRILQENVGGCNVMSPALLRLADGAVLLAFIRKDSRSSCTLFSRRSEDDGETFGEPTQINSWEAYMGFVNDSLVQLESGRVICPVYFSAAPCWTPEEHYVARMCFTDDGGRTWQAAASEVDCPKRGAMEPALLEAADGSLLMLIRTQMGRVYQSRSADGARPGLRPNPACCRARRPPSRRARSPAPSRFSWYGTGRTTRKVARTVGGARPCISRWCPRTWPHHRSPWFWRRRTRPRSRTPVSALIETACC